MNSSSSPLAALRESLAQLVDGQSMSRSASQRAMTAIIDPETPDSMVGAFLSLLRAKGPTSEELAGFVDCLKDRSTPFPLDNAHVVDTCGTGGDGKNTFNISTTSALVAAAAGAPIVKHGNRAASGVSGSADLLQRLGMSLDQEVAESQKQFERTGFVFLFAPKFHPALGRVAPVRKQLGFSTVFNILGPLLNPAGVRRQVLGVWHPQLIPLMSQALMLQSVDHAIVLHGEGGYDEATPLGPVMGRRIRGQELEPFHLDPLELGISRCEPQDLAIENAEHSERIARSIFDGERSPRRDAVVLNGALTLHVSLDVDLKEAKERVEDALDRGQVRALVESL